MNRTDTYDTVVPIIYFIIAAIAAIVLFVAAIVMWLAQLLDSGALAAVIVGAVFALIAWIIYAVSVRRSVEYMSERLETIYEVAYTARNGYKLVMKFMRSLLVDLIK